MRSRFWAVTETVILVVLIVTLIIFVQSVYSKGAKCMANPLVYGSKVLSETNNASFSCQCIFDNEPDFPIKVNSEGWAFIEQASKEYVLPNFEFPNITKGG